VLLGEHRLQCAAAGQPRFVFEVEQRAAEEPTVFDDDSLRPLDKRVVTAEDIAGTLR
jgi:hypothetical protein